MGEPPQLVRGRPLGVSPRSRQGECGIPPRFGSAISLASLGRSALLPLFATAIGADLPFSHPRPGSVQVRCARRWLAAGFSRRAEPPMVNLWLRSI